MPMTSEFGAGSTADVVNQAGDRINGAIDQRQKEDAQQANQDRLLHPLTQKWLQKVISGEMSPGDAAAAAHTEHDALGTPHFGGVAAQPASAGAYDMANASEQDAGLTRPFTVRDAADAESVGKMAAQSGQTKAMLQDVKNRAPIAVQTSKAKVGEERITSKEGIETANRTERGREADNKIAVDREKIKGLNERTAAAMRAKEQAVKEGKMDQTAIRLAEQDEKEIISLRSNISRLQSAKIQAQAQGNWDEADTLGKQINASIEEMQGKLDDLEQSTNIQRRNMGGRPGLDEAPGYRAPPPVNTNPDLRGNDPATGKPFGGAPVQAPMTPTSAPGNPSGTPPIPQQGAPAPQGAMQQSGKAIPTSTPVREPAQPQGQGGPVVKAPAPTSKDAGGIWVKNKKTGEVVKIPKDKVDMAAQAKGFAEMYEVVGSNPKAFQ